MKISGAIDSLKDFIKSLKEYPIEILLGLTFFVISILRIGENNASVFFFPIYVISYSLHRGASKYLYYLSFFLWIPVLFNTQTSEKNTVLILISILILFAGIKALSDKEFSKKLHNTVLSIIYSGIICIILSLIIEAIFMTVDVLFLKDRNLNLDLYVQRFIYIVLGPMICFYLMDRDLSGIRHRILDFVVNYIFSPALIIYSIILYVYIVKIIGKWELPCGGVSYMVSLFCVVALLTIILRHLCNKTLFNRFFGFFPFIALPPLILMWTGIVRRVSDYGLTGTRFYLILTAILLTLYVITLFAEKFNKFWKMAITLAILLAVFTFIPGISAKDFGNRSQMKRLDKVLPNILVDNKFQNYTDSTILNSIKQDSLLKQVLIQANQSYEYLKNNMSKNDFENKYGDYGDFFLPKIDNDEIKYSYRSFQMYSSSFELGEYTEFVNPDSYNFTHDNTEFFIFSPKNIKKSSDSLLVCKIGERWDYIYNHNNLRKSQKDSLMLIYENGEYKAIFTTINCDYYSNKRSKSRRIFSTSYTNPPILLKKPSPNK